MRQNRFVSAMAGMVDPGGWPLEMVSVCIGF
jgi:hypothetical protein